MAAQTIDFDYFDILSNEVVVNIVSLLDLVSLYRLTSTSKRLHAFNNISNDQWRRYYAQKWLLEDKELAIYIKDDWQKVYHARVKAENDYLLRLKLAPPPPENPEVVSDLQEGEDGKKHSVSNNLWEVFTDGSDKVETYYSAHIDPWGFILKGGDTPDGIQDCLELITAFFMDPFSEEDTKREVLSGRFEILVTGLSRFAAKDVEYLKHLTLFEDFYNEAEEYQEQRKRPFGLLGLLAKYLDMTLPVTVLAAVVYALWDVAASGELTEDFYVGLDIVPKLITIITKTTDAVTKNACLASLTWFKPSKPENTKTLANATFMKLLIDLLFEENPDNFDNFDTLLRLIITFGQFNVSVMEANKLATKLVGLQRKYSNEPEKLRSLLVVCNACCCYSKDCCVELAQDETALEFIMSLITDSKDEALRKVADSALLIIDGVARVEMGADRLLELNTVDRLLPFMEDPSNTHLFRHIYTTLHNLTDFASMSGIGDEVIAKILQYKEALVDRGDQSAAADVREACSGFWTNFSCAMPPPRDVCLKLIDRALPVVTAETTKLNLRKDTSLLLANIAEVDFEAFHGKDLTALFNYLAEYLINFDGAKERAELQRIEKEQEKEAQVKAGGVVADVPEKTGGGEGEDKMQAEHEEEVSNDMEIEHDDGEEEDSVMADYDSEAEQNESDQTKVVDHPWPLNLIAYIVRFDYLKKLAIQNERLLNKLFLLYKDKNLIYENHYMVIYFFSHIVQMPGWNSAKALECIEEFSIKAPYDIEWNFVFSLIAPYAHLLRKDNPTPLVIFGSWVITHMSTTEPGRQVLKKELDPDLLKWLKAYPHSRVEYNMTQFTRNMQKKISRTH